MVDESGSVPYSKDAFIQKLSEVQGRLAELRYIDRATGYLEGEQAQWYHHQPLGDHIVMEVPFGETVPFTRSYQIGLPASRWPWEELPWHSTREEEVNRRLAEFAVEAGTWAADNIATLTKRAEPLTYPSPASYEGHVSTLEDVSWVLENTVRSDFDKLTSSIADWEGDAADNYMTYFHEPFKDTRQSHVRLAGALAGGLATAKVIIQAGQQSLMDVVRQMSNLLYAQLVLRSQDTVQDSTASVLVLGAGAASIAGAIASSGLWIVGWEAAAAGLSAASARIPPSSAHMVDLFGASAEKLLETLETAVGDIERGLTYQYDLLYDELDTVLRRVDLLRNENDGGDGRLVPIRPDIFDGVDADTFRLPDAG
jgi:hypothetical protein